MANISLTGLGVAYRQDFDGLATAGTTNNLSAALAGWVLNETGGGGRDNELYAADTGGSNTGDTYSYGSAGSADRALGSLQSGSLAASFGVFFTNTTGEMITSLTISVDTEHWRIGLANRTETDRLDFAYNLAPTTDNLVAGTWTDFDALDAVGLVTGNAGALDGNLAVNRTTLTATITGISILPGSSFALRWTDYNANGSSADDGIGIDNFSITANGASAAPTLSISDPSVVEGNAGTTVLRYTVTSSVAAPTGGITFDIATANGTATAGSDYVARSLTGQTIAAGQTSYTFDVVVNGDTLFEADETVLVNITNVRGAAANTVIDAQGIGTILNDDARPMNGSLAVADARVFEGNAGTAELVFTVTRSNGTDGAVSASYSIVNGTTDAADFGGATSGVVTFAAGQASAVIRIPVAGDLTIEGDETFTVTLANPQGGVAIGTASAIGTVLNDDGPPFIAVSDAVVTEGDNGTTLLTYTVSTSFPATVPIVFDITTSDGTATAGSDYVTNTLTDQQIPVGASSYTFTVVVNGDTVYEPNETVLVTISNVSGAVVADDRGVGTIVNDDARPGFVHLFDENFTGFTAAGFAPTAPAGGLDSEVWRIVGLSDNPNPAFGFTGTTGDFARGVINGAQDPTGGGTYSPSANAALVLQPTGTDFETGGFIEAKIQNTSAQTATTFAVGFDWTYRNSGDRSSSLQLSYSTDGVNYTVVPDAAFATPVAKDVATAATFSVANEQVNLSDLAVVSEGFLYLRWTHLGSTGSGSRDEVGIDNVTVDAGLTSTPVVTISDVNVTEGNAGTSLATFTIARTSGTGTASVAYATADGTARAGSDYVAQSGTVTFLDGETSKTISILVNGDTRVEPNESFFVNLSNPVGVLLPDTQGRGTILNDDTGPVAIYDIQGDGHVSTFVGLAVTTTGIVTAVAGNGFYLQDPTGDGNRNTSDAIFVFTSGAPAVAVGNGVQVQGTVNEFVGGTNGLSVTQITAAAANISVTSLVNDLPTAVLIGTGGLLPPTQAIDSDRFGTFNPATDGIDFYESLEGMRVTIDQPLVVSNTNGFGETFVVASGGAGATGINSRGGITISAGDNNPERIQIDDTLAPIPALTIGDRIASVTGVVNYSFNSYEVLATAPVAITADTTPTRETTTLVGDVNHVSIASFNIENADVGDGQAKFDLLGNQIVYALRAPDIIGLQEVQDADGPGNGSDLTGIVTANALIAAIERAGGPRYTYVEVAPTTANTSGGEPGGNIRSGFLYNDDRVDLVAGSVTAVQAPAYNGTRKPLAADFTFNGQTFTAFSVHFTSRGGSEAFYGANQPPVQAGDGARTNQNLALAAYINDRLAVDPGHQFVVVGDFNGYYYEAGLTALAEQAKLVNLYSLLPVNERYSYQFEGNAQAFDNILVSGGLVNNARFDVVHYNSEQLDANRATDHDQPVALLQIFGPSVSPVTLVGGELAAYTDTAGPSSFAVRTGQIDNDPAANTGVVGTLSDADRGDTYTYKLTGAGVTQVVSDGQVVGTLIETAYGQLIVATDGRYQFAPNAAAIDALPAGRLSLDFAITVTDRGGFSSTGTFGVTLNGATDPVQLTGAVLATFVDTAANDTFAVVQGRIDNDNTTASSGAGQLRGDNGSTYTYALQGPGVSNSIINGQAVGTEIVGTYGRFVIANDGRYQYVPNDAAINAVPAGSNPVDSFTVRVFDSSGTTSDAVFSINVTGAQETAVSLTGGTLATYTDTAANGETFGLATGRLDTDVSGASNGVGNLGGGTGNVSYALTGTGVSNVVVNGAVVGTQQTSAFGRLTLSNDGRYQFEPNSVAIDTLPAGARTVPFTVQVTDTNGTTASATYNVALNGATDTQSLVGGQLASFVDTAARDTFTTVQGTLDTNPSGTANGVGQFIGDTGTRSYVLTSPNATNIVVGGVVVGTEVTNFYGKLTLATDGRYQFVPNDLGINSLSTGDAFPLGFGVRVTNTNGAVSTSSTANFTVGLTGATDTTPVLVGGRIANYVDNEATDTFAVVTGRFDTDVNTDSNGTVGFLDGGAFPVRYSLTGTGVTTVMSGDLIVGYQQTNQYGIFTVSTDGRYQFAPNNAGIDALGAGMNPLLTYVVQVTDARGASTTADYTIALTGGNDAPVVTPGNAITLAETDAALTASGNVTVTGQGGNTVTYSHAVNAVTFTLTDTHSQLTGPLVLSDAQRSAFAAAFTINAQTGAYTFNLASPDYLDPGQTVTATYAVGVANQNGETTTTNVTVSVNGTIEQGPLGTTGDDRLTGGALGELISGGNGDDTINGGAGNDILRGGSGDDYLNGGTGFNSIDGGSGMDTGVLNFNQGQYEVTQTNGTIQFAHFDQATGRYDEVHQFVNVEMFQFADGSIVPASSVFSVG